MAPQVGAALRAAHTHIMYDILFPLEVEVVVVAEMVAWVR